jgi:hypothetical protein
MTETVSWTVQREPAHGLCLAPSLHLETLEAIGRHEACGGAVLIEEDELLCVARCQACGAGWSLGVVVVVKQLNRVVGSVPAPIPPAPVKCERPLSVERPRRELRAHLEVAAAAPQYPTFEEAHRRLRREMNSGGGK